MPRVAVTRASGQRRDQVGSHTTKLATPRGCQRAVAERRSSALTRAEHQARHRSRKRCEHHEAVPSPVPLVKNMGGAGAALAGTECYERGPPDQQPSEEERPQPTTTDDPEVDEIVREPTAGSEEIPRLFRTFNIDARAGRVELVEEAAALEQFQGLAANLEAV